MGWGVNGSGVGSGEVEVGAKVGVGRRVPAGRGIGVSASAGGVKKKGVMVVGSRVGGDVVQAVHRRNRKRRREDFLDTAPL
jgi:hypothetical protein